MNPPNTVSSPIAPLAAHRNLWDFSNFADPGTWPGAIFFALIFIVLARLAAQALSTAIHRYLDKQERAGADSTAVRFLAQLTSTVIYIFAFLLYAHIVPSLQHLGTAWLTSMGVVSVVVGLAAQSTLSNLVAGIALVLYRPFRIHDRLQVNCSTGIETGRVESVHLGNTVLRTDDNRLVIIPNSTMASQGFVNLTHANKPK